MIARLIGIKTVEETDETLLIRIPWWFSDAMIDKAVANTTADARVAGRDLTITRGHRLVRIDGDRHPNKSRKDVP